MSDTREYYQKRQLVDVAEFLSGKDTNYIMCVSASMLYAIRKLVKERLFWRSTYVQSREADHYVLPDLATMDQIEEIVSDWLADSEVIEMCNQSLLDALDRISSAVSLSACCSQGAGGQMVGEDFYYGRETPVSAPTEFGPGEEFATEEDYQSHKCATANGIVNGMIATLNGMTVISLVGLTLGTTVIGVVGVGLLANPPVALIVALLATGFAIALMASLADAIDDNREEVVCALYESTGAVDAYDSFKGSVEAFALDLGIIEIPGALLSDVIMNIAPIDTFNKLFTSVGLPSIAGDIIDCDVCGEEACETVMCYFGTYNPATKVATSAFEAGSNYESVYIHFNALPSTYEFCGPLINGITIAELDPPYPQNVGVGHRLRDQATGTVYQNDEPPASPVNGCGKYWGTDKNANPFEIQFLTGV